MPHCVICTVHIKEDWNEPQSFCDVCMIQNKDVLDFTKNPEQFKKEIQSLFYHDIGESWAIHPDEAKFVMNRWGIWTDKK